MEREAFRSEETELDDGHRTGEVSPWLAQLGHGQCGSSAHDLVEHRIVEPVLAVSLVTTRKMLRGSGARTERRRTVSPVPPTTPCDPLARDILAPGVYLYWLPLGAGAHVVRLSGRAFEAIVAFLHRRPPSDLYHSALEVVTRDARFIIEMTPIPGHSEQDRGVVAEGAVGTRWARSFRIFRYEIHRWRDGAIPDVATAIESPVRVSVDPAAAERVLELVLSIPTPVWGRDELRAGEMWNSNSVTSWLLARSGADIEGIRPPVLGRAPGWDAGVAVAGRLGPPGHRGSASCLLRRRKLRRPARVDAEKVRTRVVQAGLRPGRLCSRPR